ncbi:hypothetical protein DICVIV_05647 [Dictyocaulus viviparus]|uniref:Transporter, major facilitator family protein n=1 Tax=Dictyocaulus viviparus TaxID=29172 RepID=A0A0D8XUR4_DICVI|nr:hypothetical protein DICVIV_05647 [Dictyocaulus viviparus]
MRPVPSLDSLHEYTIWHDRVKRSDSVKNGTQNSSRESLEPQDGQPMLTVTTRPSSNISSTNTVVMKKTEKPKLVFSNSPIQLNTTTTSIPLQSTADPRDVIKNEVQRAIDRLEGREKEPVPSEASDKAMINDEIIAEPSKETRTKRYLLYAAPGLGCLIGLIPAIFLVKYCGTRITLFAAMIGSAVFTAVLPLLSSSGFSALFPFRVLLGICFAPSLPVVGTLSANWGCLNEQLLFTATAFAFIQWAPIVSWPLTMLVFSNEFPLVGVYATHAVFTLFLAFLLDGFKNCITFGHEKKNRDLRKLITTSLFTGLFNEILHRPAMWILISSNAFVFFRFLIFYRDRPQYHPWVNGLELNRIVAGKVQELKTNRAQSGACPTLMRSLAAWSLWIGVFGFFFATALLTTFIPSLLSCQEVFMVDYLGFYSVLPFMLVPFIMLAAGLINSCSCCSSTAHVRVWNSVGAGLTAILFVVLPIILRLQLPSISAYLLLFVLAPFGLCVSGVLRSLCLVGRAYTQHITAYMGASMAAAFITTPLLVFFYINTNSLAEWTRVFMTSAALIIITSVVFAVFGRGRASNWAASSWDPLISSKMRNLQPIDFSQDECGLYELRLIEPNRK